MNGDFDTWSSTLSPPPRPRPIKPWRVTGGVALAFVCHLPVFAIWTYAAAASASA